MLQWFSKSSKSSLLFTLLLLLLLLLMVLLEEVVVRVDECCRVYGRRQAVGDFDVHGLLLLLVVVLVLQGW